MLVGNDQPVRVDDKSGSAVGACGDLHDASLNTFDEICERRFSLVGQVGGTDELDVERGPIRRRGCARGRRRRYARGTVLVADSANALVLGEGGDSAGLPVSSAHPVTRLISMIDQRTSRQTWPFTWNPSHDNGLELPCEESFRKPQREP